MPAERKLISDLSSFRYSPVKLAKGDAETEMPPLLQSNFQTQQDGLREMTVYYPQTRSERDAFRTENGKRVPPHHWAVYDLIRTIPVGKVSTYKDVCAALGEGSPRSVGGALRNNPFAPRIPCHRVIARGEWMSSSPVENVGERWKKNWHEPFKGGGMGPLQNEKVRMLAQEGVEFGKDGKMLVSRDVVWKFDGGLEAEK
ncbi:6-O-methylguanine DNA methyltransferase [Lactifluus volemus]|nr:6-O-methylguanine DNA methyltransferase [Lactifluus volemus]